MLYPIELWVHPEDEEKYKSNDGRASDYLKRKRDGGVLEFWSVESTLDQANGLDALAALQLSPMCERRGASSGRPPF